MTQLLYICGPKPTVIGGDFAPLVAVSSTDWAGVKNLVPEQLMASAWEFEGEAAHEWCESARIDLTVHDREFEESILGRVLRLVLPAATRVVVSYNDEARAVEPTASMNEFVEDVRRQVGCDTGGDVNAIYQPPTSVWLSPNRPI